jgi:mRNA-degrading endonuclease RelE of RelBE toxin-antitoxin system
MAYQVKFSKQAAKFFRKLEPHIKERIREKFREIAEDPFRYAEHFEGDGHKIRIGDFRALVDIYQEAQKILVRVLDKRGRVYK